MTLQAWATAWLDRPPALRGLVPAAPRARGVLPVPSRAGKGGAPPPAERRAGWGQVVNFDFPATPKLLVHRAVAPPPSPLLVLSGHAASLTLY